MLTREQERATNVRDIEHIVETVLEEEMFYDYLKSLRIKSAREIITATPEGIRSATYPDENGVTTAISIEDASHILTFIAYVKWRNTSPKITERINDDYNKVTFDNINDARRGSLFRTSWGNYLYDSTTAKMIQDTSQLQTIATASTISTLPHPRSSLSEWEKGVPQNKSLKELVDLDQWLRDSVTLAMAHTWSRRKLRFVDDILNSTWILTAGQDIILEQGDMPDTQKLITKLKEISALSVDASNRADNIMAKFSSIRFGDGNVSGNTNVFLAHVHGLFRRHNELISNPSDCLSDDMKNSFMKNAVHNCMELRNVSPIQDGYAYTYEQYYAALKHAAEDRDTDASKQHGLGSISKWKVYCTTWGENYNVDNLDQVHELLAEMILNEAHVRLNEQEQVKMGIKPWRNISTEGQSLWDKMTEKDRGTILTVITDASKAFQPRTQYPPWTAQANFAAHSPSPITAHGRDKASEFKKGIKRDSKDFPLLKDDKSLDAFWIAFDSESAAQDVTEISDGRYKAETVEDKQLFQLKQTFMYSVLQKTLLTDQGKACVHQYEASSDAQAIIRDMREYSTMSTKYSSDGKWNGTLVAFIHHWQEQVRKYENLVPSKDHFSDGLKKNMLQNAVSDIEELHNIRGTSNQLRGYLGTQITYHAYGQLLLSAAEQYDQKLLPKSSGAGKSHKRQIYFNNMVQHEEETTDKGYCDANEQFDIASSVAMINANYHGSGPSQFAPGSRMNKMMWDSLTPKAQRIWDDNKQANSPMLANVQSARCPDTRNLGFDLLGGEILPSIVKSIHDSEENEDKNKQVKMPIFQPTDLVGGTFLMEPQEDGQCHRAHIVQAIEEQENDLAHNSTRIQFLCWINDDETEETIAYNEVLQNLNQSSFNVMIEWENGRSQLKP